MDDYLHNVTSYLRELNIFLSWKGKAIGLCPSRRGLTKWKWSWNLAIQDRILYLDDVLKPDRDTVIMHTSQLLAYVVLSSMKSEWCCFSLLYFKAPAVTLQEVQKSNHNPGWENRKHEVHCEGFTIELQQREKTMRKALRLSREFSKDMSCATSFLRVGNDSSSAIKKWGEYCKGSPA